MPPKKQCAFKDIQRKVHFSLINIESLDLSMRHSIQKNVYFKVLKLEKLRKDT